MREAGGYTDGTSGRLRPVDRAVLRPLLYLVVTLTLLLFGGAAVRTVAEVREHRARPAQVITLHGQERVTLFAPMMEHRLQRLRRDSLVEGEARLSTADIDVMIDWTREMRGKTAAERAETSTTPHEYARP